MDLRTMTSKNPQMKCFKLFCQLNHKHFHLLFIVFVTIFNCGPDCSTSHFDLQDIAFINPANVVFVYLLVRDCVDHNIVKETELQVKPFSTLSICFQRLLHSGRRPGVSLSLVQLHGKRDQLPPQAFPRWDGQGEVLGSLCHHYQQAQVRTTRNDWFCPKSVYFWSDGCSHLAS